jgi:hypothetical protein
MGKSLRAGMRNSAGGACFHVFQLGRHWRASTALWSAPSRLVGPVAAVLAQRLVAVMDNLSGIADCHLLSVPIGASVHNAHDAQWPPHGYAEEQARRECA